MVNITTDNKQVTNITSIAKGATKVIKEGRARIAIIISGLEESTVLGENTELAI